jgi:gliding motility-associated-like protein
MKKNIYILLFCSFGQLMAQTVPLISPQVINSAGGNHVINGISITDNVGEPFITTLGDTSSPAFVTQGFIQPLYIPLNDFTVTAMVNDLSCFGRNDGKISTTLTSAVSIFNARYLWLPPNVCPGKNCSTVDSLKAGTYTLSVIFTYTDLANQTQTVTAKMPSQVFTVLDVGGPCRVKVFTGITINGDGNNDHLFIENISEFPNNNITIYNRWGQQLYNESGYDNINKFWPKDDEISKLVSGTYFYVLDTGDGNKVLKGWIEIIKN